MKFVLIGLIPFALCAQDINPQPYIGDVRYLASPEMKGRASGSPELEKAGRYIAAQFKSFGLKPADGKDFEQAFPVTVGAHLGSDNRFSDQDAYTAVDSEYRPLSFSKNGSIKAPVVFAGYGITDKQKNYDDYAGIDVKDKIVLILRHEPKETGHLSSRAAFAEKAVNAKMHGAAGVLVVNDVFAHDGKDKPLEKFALADGPANEGILFAQISEGLAEALMGGATGRTRLRAVTEDINRDGKPHSFPLNVEASMSVDVVREVKTVHNVAAYLPGRTDEYVVIGAHYDHLGLGGPYSLDPSKTGTVHPGADDNASGTAGVIELARWFSKQPKQKRGVLFMTFAGEELGLLGSEWYVEHPVLPLSNAVAMINMDMIGRIREGKVYLSGTGTGSTFPRLIATVKPPPPLKMDISEKTGYGSSDQTSFNAKQVPVLFFFSGLHADYHKATDTADKIDYNDAAKLLDYVADVTLKLENDALRPKFQHVAEPRPSASAGDGAGSGYGPDFGSVPDFNETDKGVRFADIVAGSPASKAGLRAGDILTEFDGKQIANLYDFTYALRAHKPGDLVLVKVLRDGKPIEAKVLLTERR
ncbi:MAG: M28 family peptidase [Bryobacteraceae bacterium]